MKSLKKRVVTTALAGAMALSMAATAFAADPSTKVTATYAEIPIDVTVTPTVTTTLNPMGMPVQLAVSSSYSGDKPEITSQIANQPAYILNNTKNKLAVSATVTGAVKGNFKFAATGWAAADEQPSGDTAAKVTATQGFIFLEAKKAANGDLTASSDSTKADADTIADTFAAWNDTATDLTDADKVKAAVESKNGDAIVVLKAAAVKSAQPIVVMDAADENATSKKIEPTGALVRLGGQMVEDPKTAWTKSDGFTATIVYSFKVVKDAPAADDTTDDDTN